MTVPPDLFEAAKSVMDKAYAPYSKFPVGVSIKASSGKIFSGANVENAAYPQGWCAEASALAAMVSAGDRRILEVVVVAKGKDLVTPCGGCRQKLREFAADTTPIHLCSPEGWRRTISLGELLPLAFGPEHLAK